MGLRTVQGLYQSMVATVAFRETLEKMGMVPEWFRDVFGQRSQEELRASFARKLEKGAPVTKQEVAAWHGVSLRQVSRWISSRKLEKLLEYGRRAMFNPRVACRLRPERKEG